MRLTYGLIIYKLTVQFQYAFQENFMLSLNCTVYIYIYHLLGIFARFIFIVSLKASKVCFSDDILENTLPLSSMDHFSAVCFSIDTFVIDYLRSMINSSF